MKCAVLALLFVVFAACVHAQTVQQAICYMVPTQSYLLSSNGQTSVSGTITFTYVATAVTNVTVSVSGLPASKALGFHIHQYGMIGSFDGTGAGGHFNPFNASHAYPYNQPRHVGDMGNLTTDSNGVASATFTNELIRFNGAASIIGRGVIIHAAADDGQTQPTGNSGARIAQCVVGVQSVPSNSVNTAIADFTASNFAIAELTTAGTLYTSQALSGRVVFEQQTATTLISVRICGFLPGTVHAIGLAQFGDRSGVGNSTFSFTSVTADSQGVIDVNITNAAVAVNGSTSVVGQSFVVYAGVNANNASELALTGVVGVASSNPGQPACGVEWGACYLRSTSSAPNPVNGTLIVKHILNDPSGVTVTGTIIGLAPNTTHGWHVHQFGHVGVADGNGTGLHFNPFSHNHSLPNNTRHIGDFGNFVTDLSGNANINSFFSSEINMGFSGPSTIIGKAIIIHETMDDGTGTTGNAGKRYSQCVIGIANTLTNPLITNVAKSDNVGAAVGSYFGTCELYSIGSTVTGRVIFSEAGGVGQMRVQAKICGVAANSAHGFHIHQYGDLTGAALNTNIASHYNPSSVAHGYPESAVHHIGDMGNVTADIYGNIVVDKVFPGMSLTGPFSIMGRSVVLHAANDDGGQPTGNAGSPIATCAIGFVNTVDLTDIVCLQTTVAPTPTATPSSGATTAAPTPTPTPTSAAGIISFNALIMFFAIVATLMF